MIHSKMERKNPCLSNRTSLTQSLTGTQYEALRNNPNNRLTESCHGQISTDRVSDTSDSSDLTCLNWLSCLTPQNLVCGVGRFPDVDNVGAEESLGSSMNSTTTDHSEASHNYSLENSSNIPLSPLGQHYQKFLEERKRSEGDSRRFQQSNPVVMNHSQILYESNPHQFTKPPLSFGALICLAIESSPARKLPVKDIYMWIEGNFPYYKNASGMSWKNSVRHNLSLSKAFVKMPRPQPGNSKSSDNCSCHKNGAATTNKTGSPQGELCHCCKTDEEGGKGCLWGINDDYRNSLIASFRRSGLTYPLILPMNRIATDDGANGERNLPEFYSQAALQRQQQPQPVNSINHVMHQQVIGHCPDPQRNHIQFVHPRHHYGHRPRHVQPEEGDDRQVFMNNLRFFNQAIKRTQALMFKEQIDEGDEEDEEENEIEEEIPLENNGYTCEQIIELNHLARRGRRKKTPVFRHITPIPAHEHDYCKTLLGPNDLYESETDNEAEVPEETPPPPVRKQRLSLNAMQAAHGCKRKYQERTSRKPPTPHKQPWLGHRRSSSYSGRSGSYMNSNGPRGQALARSGPPALLSHESASGAHGNNAILQRRRRPGRPPKNRNLTDNEETKRNTGSHGPGRKRIIRRDTDSGSLADDEELDDASTEPMEDSSYGEGYYESDENYGPGPDSDSDLEPESDSDQEPEPEQPEQRLPLAKPAPETEKQQETANDQNQQEPTGETETVVNEDNSEYFNVYSAAWALVALRGNNAQFAIENKEEFKKQLQREIENGLFSIAGGDSGEDAKGNRSNSQTKPQKTDSVQEETEVAKNERNADRHQAKRDAGEANAISQEDDAEDNPSDSRMNARSPENVPPHSSGLSTITPRRRGRRPRKDIGRSASSEKDKVSPLTPTKPRFDHNEGNVSSRSGLPKRKAAVNAPAVWNKKKKLMNN